MEGRVLIQYIIDTSDVMPVKKQEATEYLAKLEEAARQSAQPDVLIRCEECGALLETDVHCDNCGTFHPTRR